MAEQQPPSTATSDVNEKSDAELTCDVLCSLGNECGGGGGVPADMSSVACSESEASAEKQSKTTNRACPKQHQLPMFLSSKFSDKIDDRCRWLSLSRKWDRITIDEIHQTTKIKNFGRRK